MPSYDGEADIPDASYLVFAARADDPREDGSDRTLHEYDVDHGRAQQQPVGFWHYRMDKVRAHVLELWVQTVVVLVIFILAVLALFWATRFHTENNMRALKVQVVDFDGQLAPNKSVVPLVGPMVTRLAQQVVNETGQLSLGYEVVSPADFDYNPIKARRSVYDFDCYAAMVVNPNATRLLEEAVRTGHSTYDPTGAVQMFIVSARDESTYYNYIIPQLETFTQKLMAEFGPTWTQRLAINNSITKNMLALAPIAVNPGILPLQIDLRPIRPTIATTTVTSGLTYLAIIAVFPFYFFQPIHQKYVNPQGHPPLRFWHFIIWRWLATIVSYVFLSLAYSLVPLAFQFPFAAPPASPVEAAQHATRYGHASFVVYWLANLAGTAALGLASENMARLLGAPWAALWQLLWLATNMAAASASAAPPASRFFAWRVAWPLHHVAEATRAVLFDLRARVGLNFGVLLAWVAVGSLLFPLCCRVERWRADREAKAAAAAVARGRYVVRARDGEDEALEKVGTHTTKGRSKFMSGLGGFSGMS